MHDTLHNTMHDMLEKLKWLALAACLLVVGIFLFSLIFPAARPTATAATAPASAEAATTADDTPVMYDTPNAVTSGLSAAADNLDRTLSSLDVNFAKGGNALSVAGIRTGNVIATGVTTSAQFAGHNLAVAGRGVGTVAGGGARLLVRSVSNTAAFVVNVPSAVFGFVTDTPVVSAVIKPADNMPLQTIDAAAPIAISTVSGTVTAAPATAKTAAQSASPATADESASWPIHGEITTLFGVPHWPYQPTHTGLDISDGKPSGVSPIHPYRPGKVIEAVNSYSGLGNHVVVDHGGGITSVYGHMSSLSVSVGQSVDKSTTLGLEGSTGASTGTHLHFEIRVNGQPVDPQKYVSSPL